MVPSLAVAVCLGVPRVAAAQFLTLEEVASGLARPISITNAGDGSGRLFIVQQGGEVLVRDGDRMLPTPFLDISRLVFCCGEQGLLDIAFHPNYAKTGLVFVDYTDRSNNTVIARYHVSDDPNRIDTASATIVLRVKQPYRNHNGGQIRFGPDGYLYIGLGDGGSAGDPGNRAQNKRELLGKLLRIDVDRGQPYGIPPGNPFASVVDARAEIWALGLRNPWRFSFDRWTGDLLIGDVGQSRREEIDFQPASSHGGENYGWRRMEGSACYNPRSDCNDGTLVLPVLEVDHLGGNCSIIGGYRYRGASYPQADGTYFFGDYCSGRIWAAAPRADGTWAAVEALDTDYNISTFGEDDAGELYVAHYAARDGAVYRMALHDALGGLRPSGQ